jgi:hypothetical protein
LATDKDFGSVVLMGKDQALEVGEYMINAGMVWCMKRPLVGKSLAMNHWVPVQINS